MFPNVGPPEMIVIGLVAVLLFGRRLPEVGRSLGRGIVEFKKGLRGIEDELDVPSTPASKRVEDYRPALNARPEVPKFEPPAAESVPPQLEPQAYQD